MTEGKLARGTVVGGRYRVDEKVGSGGNCRVYRAWEKAFDRHVAIKILRPELAEQPAERERFLKEAQTCASLRHPHVLEVFEVGVHEGLPYLVMPFVAGRSLHELSQGVMGLAPYLEFLAQVAEALGQAHGQGVLHRDLKPENVLVSEDGRALVADWGLARRMNDSSGLTKTGIILGTPRYMAPEQIMAKPLSAATDLYALGVMLFEAVTGLAPFDSPDVAVLLRGHVNDEAPNTLRFRPELPGELHELVAELLRKEADRRPPSARSVARRIRAIVPLLPGGAKTGRGAFDRSGILERVTQQLPGEGRSSRAATTRPVFKKSRRLALPLVSLALFGFLLALTVSKWREKAPAVAVEASSFQLLPPRLKGPDRLVLAWEGRFRGRLELELRGRGPTAVATQKLTRAISSRAGAMGGEEEILLERPLVEETVLDFEARPASASATVVRSSVDLPVSACLNEFLAPVDAVGEQGLSDLVQGLDLVRSRDERARGKAPEATAAQISELLGKAGLSPLFRHRLRAWHEKGLVGEWTVDSELSRRLLPLRCVEAILVGTPSGRVPFEGVGKILGFDCDSRLGRRTRGYPGRCVASCHFLSKVVLQPPGEAPVTQLVSRLWLLPVGVDKGEVKGNDRMLTRDFIADRIWDLMPRGFVQRTSHAEVSLKRSGDALGQWPPRRAWLELVLRRFPRTLRMQLLFEGQEAIWICNSGPGTTTGNHLVGQPVSILLRLDPSRLPRPELVFALRTVPYPYDPMWQAVGLRSFRLFVD